MHTYSADMLKNRKPKHKVYNEPREGTKIREVYDLFYANKGKAIDFSTSMRGSARILYSLVDFYGLDIIRVEKNRWCLVGEWFGKVYVDYTQEENQ